jgi:hypothetical protein
MVDGGGLRLEPSEWNYDKTPSQICYHQGIITHTDDSHSIFILRCVDWVKVKVELLTPSVMNTVYIVSVYIERPLCKPPRGLHEFQVWNIISQNMLAYQISWSVPSCFEDAVLVAVPYAFNLHELEFGGAGSSQLPMSDLWAYQACLIWISSTSSKQRVLHRHRNQAFPSRKSQNGNYTWQFRMYRNHSSMWSQPDTASFFTTICSTSKNGGELRTEIYTSAAISVIHQAALEGT